MIDGGGARQLGCCCPWSQDLRLQTPVSADPAQLDTFILLSDLSSQTTVQDIARIVQYVTVRECANVFWQACASEVSRYVSRC